PDGPLDDLCQYPRHDDDDDGNTDLLGHPYPSDPIHDSSPSTAYRTRRKPAPDNAHITERVAYHKSGASLGNSAGLLFQPERPAPVQCCTAVHDRPAVDAFA